MKRLSLAMTALAVMGLMTMVSCRKPVSNITPVGEKITFSATTDGGSKTTIDGNAIKWSPTDKVSVNGTKFDISNISSDGRSADCTGENVGMVGGKYFASYPYSSAPGYTNDGSSVKFNIPATQDSPANLSGQIPMVGYTTTKKGALSFQSMVNVLELSLTSETGTVDVTQIEVSSADEYLYGDFTVSVTDDPANPGTPGVAGGGKTRTVSFSPALTLNAVTPQKVYVVLPVFGNSSSHQISIKFSGTDGVMTVTPDALSNSTTPNHRYQAAVAVKFTTPMFATVITIPVCAIHATCASSGGVVTGGEVEEQGVCWGTNLNPTINDSKYIHNYEYSQNILTPKNGTIDNTFTGFIGGSPDSENRLTPGTTYHVRAYIRKGNQIVYGNDVTFKTLSSEVFPTDDESTVNFNLKDYPDLEWSKYNLGVDPNQLTTAADWYGDYYQWGDNAACSKYNGDEGKYYVNCNWQSYRFAQNGIEKFTKYCSMGNSSYWYPLSTPDDRVSLDDSDDCVHQTLGGNWRLPTGCGHGEYVSGTASGEWMALYKECLWVWTNHYNGISDLKGHVVYKGSSGIVQSDGNGDGGYSSYTLSDVHIFIPAADIRLGTTLSESSSSFYWSKSLYSPYPINAYIMHLGPIGVGPQMDVNIRCVGITVRPVRTKVSH